MIEIIPAIMPKNITDLEEKVGLVAGHVSSVQLDIMDGKFVPAKTWPYHQDRKSFDELLKEEKGLPFWEQTDYEIDLMVADPEHVMSEWITAGAARLIIHVESTKNLPLVIKNFREWFPHVPGEKPEIELGLALNIDTPTTIVTEYLEDIDFVQFMGIDKIGFQSQPFNERVLDKMREFHNNHPEFMISVDGGVTLDNARQLVEAGAKRLISGSAIFAGNDAGEVIDSFRKLVL